MTADRWTELEALAKDATTPPWEADREAVFTPWTGWCDANGLPEDDRELVARAAEPDARYIAAANPQTVLDLIAHVRELEAMRAKVLELHKRRLAWDSDHHDCHPSECDRAGEGEQIAVCDECSTFVSTVDYPCLTARVLGVTE